jgi:hypothetical protein
MKKPLLLASLAVLLVAALSVCLGLYSRSKPPVQELSEAQFNAKFQSHLIAKCQVSYPPRPPRFVQDVRGTFYETDDSGRLLLENGARKESRFHASFRLSGDLTRRLIANTNFSVVTLNPVVQTLKDFVARR